MNEDPKPLVSYDGGETWQEAVIERRKPWRVEVALVGALLLALTAFGWSTANNLSETNNQQTDQIEQFVVSLRDAAVSGCERQNEVRQALRAQITHEIHAAEISDPHLFPSVTPQQFHRLVADRIETLKRQRAAITDADCDAVYPEKDHPASG